MQKIAHDLKNKLLPSILYLRQGKQEQGLESLEKIVETLNDLQRSTEITGHIMIDMILVYKTATAKARDININIDSQLRDPVYIPDADLSVILSNALDNAIEAVEKIDDIHMRTIVIQLRSGHGLFSFMISNPVKQAVNIRNGGIITTKTDPRNHGIGLNSIKELVCKNHGFIDLKCKHRAFTLTISFENLPLNP